MPPRSAKKAAGPSGKKAAAARAGKKAAQPPAAAAAEEVKAEEQPKVEEVKAKEQPKVEEAMAGAVVEEVAVEEVIEAKAEEKARINDEDVEDVKESYEEEDRGERLELEDEPEYEPEDDAAVYFEERSVEHGEEEPVEVYEGEDGESDMAEDEEPEINEEIQDGGEDVEGQEDEGGEEEHELDGEEAEHHEIVKEHRKRKEFEVFVGGLDKDATEDDLRKVFGAVGEIVEVRLMMNPLTKKNKGFAFIRFATVEQAKRACSELKSPVVKGKPCGVAPVQDSDTLFVGNICKTWTKVHLKEKLKSYGVENVEDLTLVEDTNNEGMNRGFAFLEFSSRDKAVEAFKRLQKRDVSFGADRNAKVSFADSFIEQDDEIMSQVKTIFIDGLPASWDEDRVKEYLKKYGSIDKIELARNMPSAKRKDFGFVSFDSHENAVACIADINNKEIGEGDKKVKVRARLSRPLQRGRGGRGPRGDTRSSRLAPRGGYSTYSSRPPPRRLPSYAARPIRGRLPPVSSREFKRPVVYRDKRPFMAVPERPRRLPPPERVYDRRPPPIPAYPKTSSRRDYARRDEPPPRSRPVVEYASRGPMERRSSYRDEYSSRATGYPDIPPRSAPRPAERRAYVDEGYGRKLERPPPGYREGRGREYDSISGSKRPYSEMDDIPPRYADVSVRQSRPRMEYGVSGSSAHYDDAYGDRLGRSHMGYGSSRSTLASQDAMYSSRQGMGYGGGPVSGSVDGGMYPSSFSSSYLQRGSDVGGGSYSSLYTSRSMGGGGGGGYSGGGGSGSYY